jgi:hypothetical protein
MVGRMGHQFTHAGLQGALDGSHWHATQVRSRGEIFLSEYDYTFVDEFEPEVDAHGA